MADHHVGRGLNGGSLCWQRIEWRITMLAEDGRLDHCVGRGLNGG